MIKKIACLVAIVGITLLSGCTTAGPFVTNISSDGRGNLIIEKSQVKMNAFMGTVSNEGGTTTTIRILPEEKAK
jgi:outer membrane protein assembly factor BamE (lipoprotein component of BamABCDE complex)